MLRCEDYSLYTGITTDVKRRMSEHFNQTSRAAQYTKTHKPKGLELLYSCKTRSQASSLEYYLKKLSKKEKEMLIQKESLKEIIGHKIDVSQFKKEDVETNTYDE